MSYPVRLAPPQPPVVMIGAGLFIAGLTAGIAGVAFADKSARLSVAVAVNVNCAVTVGDLALDPQGASGAIPVTVGCVDGGEAAVILEDRSAVSGGASGCTFYQDAGHRRAWGGRPDAGNSRLGGGRTASSTVYVQLPPRSGPSELVATILF